MQITILDGYALNPGDLSWEPFNQLGSVTIYDRTPVGLILERAKDADVVLTNKVPLSRATLEALPNLKYIGVLATGYNIIDVAAARERNVTVSNVPGYSTDSVAQLAFALLLELTNEVGHLSAEVRNGRWTESEDWCFWDAPQIELAGKTMGIIGYGTIGRKMAELAVAFGMNVLAVSRTPKSSVNHSVRFCSMEEVFPAADVISIHCPLTKETEGLINAERLAKMKSTAYLLNTARGPIVRDQDLADALNAGVIAGAGIDVLSVEPPRAGNPLFQARNCVITPHIAWGTTEARKRLMARVLSNLQAFLAGQPVDVVN